MFVKKRKGSRESIFSRVNDSSSLTNSPPKISSIPEQFQESFINKWQNYQQVKNKIFGSNNVTNCVAELNTSVHIKNLRERHKRLKKEYRMINKTVLNIDEIGSDHRPFTNVVLFDESINGLMDSGASISVLGDNSLEFLQKHHIHMKPLFSVVKTANGASLPIIGKVETDITWRNTQKPIILYIAPALRQKLYLGFDFFKLYGLDQFLIEEVDSNEEVIDVKSHILEPAQKQRLDQIIQMFPNSAQMGLGRTHLLKHYIDTGDARPIKKRHYPISPAKERLLFTELDRMISLNVIEESISPWSSPVTTVIKPGKTRMCVDSRELNKVTKKDAYPIPNIDGLLMRLTETRFISALDLKDAFWQIPLESSSKEKTAFSVAIHMP